MLIILRKSSIKRTLTIATILILVGMSLSNPFKAQAAESNLYYLYPYPSSNPTHTSLFWSEANPKLGAYTLPMWSEIVPDKQIVVALPEGYGIRSAMIANNIGKAIATKISNRLKNGKNPVVNNKANPKDVINYERVITPEGGITEKIRVEIVDHFKNNDNFEKYMEIIKNGLIPNELPDQKPAPKDDGGAQVITLFGNTITLAGIALAGIKLIPLLL